MKRALFMIVGLLIGVLASAATLNGYRIALDPGHGGSDYGGISQSHYEKTKTLESALALQSELQANQASVFLTRNNDSELSLSARRSSIVAYNPHLALTIHLNNAPEASGLAYGTEVWWGGNSLYPNSFQLANHMIYGLYSTLRDGNFGCAQIPTHSGEYYSRGVKRNDSWVLINSGGLTIVQTEGLFWDNVQEHNFLNSAEGMNSYVKGHVCGIYLYLNSINPDIPATPPTDNGAPVIHRTAIERVDQYTIWVFAQVTDDLGVKSVKFPTWTAQNGQDDLWYHEAGSGEWIYNGQSYNYLATISVSDHHNNELENYTIQCYAWDNADNEAACWVADNYNFDQTPLITIDRATLIGKDNNAFYLYANVNTENVRYFPATDYKIKATVRAMPQHPTTANPEVPITVTYNNSANITYFLNTPETIEGTTYNARVEVARSQFANRPGPYYVDYLDIHHKDNLYDCAEYKGEINHEPFAFDDAHVFLERAEIVQLDYNNFRIYSYINFEHDNLEDFALTTKIWTTEIPENSGIWRNTFTFLEGDTLVNGRKYNSYNDYNRSDYNNINGQYFAELSTRDRATWGSKWSVLYTDSIYNHPFTFRAVWIERAICVPKDNESFYVYAYLDTSGTATPDTYVVRTKVATTDKEKWLTFDHNGKNRLDEEITIDGLTYNCYGIFDRSDFENSDGPYFVETRAMANNENYLTDYALFNDRIFNNPFTFKKTETTDNNIAHKNNKILIYNTHEMLFVENVQAKLIELFNVSGQKVRSVSNRNSLNLNNLNGVYIVVVTDTKGNRQIGKIVK